MMNCFNAALISLLLLLSWERTPSEKHKNIVFNHESRDTSRIGLKIGNKAPELVLLSPDSVPIALSSLRGKLVLIDFWASWCQGCRTINPRIVNLYKKYKDKQFTNGKGFIVYSVSLDTKKDLWLKAIEKDGLIWDTNVCDFKGTKSSTHDLYRVFYLPMSYLIDGNGIIIEKQINEKTIEKYIKH